MAEVKFEIEKTIGILSERKGGWTKELNLVSWNGNDPKYEIRTWSAQHQSAGKGITLSREELLKLKSILNEFDELDEVTEDGE